MFKEFLSHVQLNGFVLALIGTVAAAPFLACRGTSPEIFHALGSLAIASLFFLQGARLSRAALVAGAEHWRLHAAIAFATFVLFSIAWVGVMGGSAARAPAVAVVGSVVCLRSSLHRAILNRLDLDLARQCRGGSLFSGRVQSGWPVSHPDFLRACVWGAQKRDQSGGSQQILSVTDRGLILLIVYAAFSASVVAGLWQRVPVATLATLALIESVLLAAALLIMISGSRVMRFDPADETAIVFCGSQKSVISGIPIANALIPGPALGLFVLPITLYHSLQLLVCAWLAKRYTSRPDGTVNLAAFYRACAYPWR